MKSAKNIKSCASHLEIQKKCERKLLDTIQQTITDKIRETSPKLEISSYVDIDFQEDEVNSIQVEQYIIPHEAASMRQFTFHADAGL